VICTSGPDKGTTETGSLEDAASPLSESEAPAAPARAAFKKLLRSDSITTDLITTGKGPLTWVINRIFSLMGQRIRAWTSIFEQV
jgi:hypothetical protein